MRRLFLFGLIFLLLATSVSATDYFIESGVADDGGGADSKWNGIKFTFNTSGNITALQKFNADTATLCNVWGVTEASWLDSDGTFSGDNCSITAEVVSGQVYHLVLKGNSQRYVLNYASWPIVKEVGSFNQGTACNSEVACGSPTVDDHYRRIESFNFEVISGSPPAPSYPYAHINLYDLYDNSSLTDGTVCYLGTDSNTSVGGTCSFFNHTTGLNYSVESTNYFQTTGTATENATTDVYLYGAFVLLSASDVLGDTVVGFNVSAGSQSNESLSGSTRLLLSPNVTTEVTFSRSGWFDALLNVSTGSRDVGSFNVSSFHNNEFLINASDALSGVPVSSFSVNASNGSNIFLLNTSAGSVLFPLLQGYSWNFFIDAVGFAFSNVTLAANASENNYEFSLLPQNSIFLYFFDLTTLNPIFLNVTVDFSKGNLSFQNSSNSSEMIVSGLDPGTWTLEADAPLYESSQFFVTVTDRTVQDVDVFLLNSTLTGETTIVIKEADTANDIPDAVVTLQTKVAGNWVTFDQKITDLFGTTFFQLEQGEEYQIIIEADGFSTKTGVFVRTKSNYIITLSSENTQSFSSYLNDFSYVVAPSILNLS
ncbi:hypothetical protein GOV10_02205, partial [Candidatus Woesearchaeota archaeon]|nr:hypothetical protein [Candidatus Woesearchaeota archaeon]